MVLAPAMLLALAAGDAAAGTDGCVASSLSDDASSAMRATVRIETPRGHGSGVIVDDEGHILTAAHVVGEASEVQVSLSAGPTLTARVLRVDPALDLALVDIDGSGFACAALTPDRVPVGAPILALGHPTPTEPTSSLTRGVVSGYPTREERLLLQTDAALSPGFSGGGLFSEGGFVVGITSAKLTGAAVEGVGFAVPAERVLTWLDEEPEALVVTGRPAAERLSVRDFEVYDADAQPLHVGDFATRIGQERVSAEVAQIQRRGENAWMLGVATIPLVGTTAYYGGWLLAAPPASNQFKIAAAGTGLSVVTGVTLGLMARSRVRRNRNLSYRDFYTSAGLEKTVERYNDGDIP